MREEARKERAKIARRIWREMTEEERAKRKAAIAEGMRKRWAERSETEREAIGKRISEAKKEKASV